MVQINFAQKTVNVKVVYYGPGMSGKTTNLEVVHQRAPDTNRGELTSISTDGDRTLFFDYMPLDLGTVAGMRTCFQLYTVPGQVYYNSTRKLVLQGVDGVIFIADSAASMIEQNLESLRNLEENLNEYGKSLATLPHVIQFNKRDLPDVLPVEELNRLMNTHQAPCFEGVANSGQGVFPTIKALAAAVLKNIMQESGNRGTGAPAAPGAGAAAGAPAAPTPAAAKVPSGAGLELAGSSQTPLSTAASAGQNMPGGSQLDIAEPVAASASGAGRLMKSRTASSPKRPVQKKARKPGPRGAAAGRAKKASSASKQVKAPKKGGATVGAFVGVALVIGAVAAWVVLNVL